MSTNKNKLIIYSVGFVNLSCCAPDDMSDSEIEEEVNHRYPTGLDTGWFISEDDSFGSGSPHPGLCELNSGRLHYLLYC